MAKAETRRDRVGVRELRQNLSVYLDRVKAGETLEVTERGKPVAQFAPLPSGGRDWLDELVAAGKVRPAQGDLLEYLRNRPPLPAARPGEPTLSEILQEMREDPLP